MEKLVESRVETISENKFFIFYFYFYFFKKRKSLLKIIIIMKINF